MSNKQDLSDDNEQVSIINLQNGAAVELFDDELQRVLDNCGDPNTKPDAVREVHLIVKIKPDEKRRTASVTIQAKSKLQPFREASTVFFLGKKGDTVFASERNVDQMTIEEALQQSQEKGPRPVASGQ